MALRSTMQGVAGICYLLYLLLGRVIFPPIFVAVVVDRRTRRPVPGVRLLLEARDERMMLPGYPHTTAMSDSAGLVSGVLAESSLGYCPTYYMEQAGGSQEMVVLRGFRSVLGLTWLLQRLKTPQVLEL